MSETSTGEVPVSAGTTAFRATTPRRRAVTIGLLAIGIGLTWSLATPLFGGPDEPQHAIHADASGHGQILGNETSNLIDGLEYETSSAYVVSKSYNPCFASENAVTPRNGSPACLRHDVPGSQREVAAIPIGRYPPLYHVLVGVPTQPLASHPYVRLWAMRVITAVMLGALVAIAWCLLADVGRVELAGVGLLAALTPEVYSLGGVVTPSAPEIGAAILLWCAGLCMIEQTRDDRLGTPTKVALTVAGIILILTRQLGPLWLAVIGAELILVGGWALARTWFRSRWIVTTLSAWATAFGLQAAWLVAAKTLQPGLYSPGMEAPLLASFKQAVERSFHYWGAQMVGWFGFLESRTPAAFLIIFGVVVVALVGVALRGSEPRARLVLGATTAAAWAVPIILATGSRVAFVWQGRQFLPLAIGVPIFSGYLISRQRTELPARLITTLTAALVAIEVVSLWAALRRYVVGVGGSWTLTNGTGWNPPIPAWALIVMNLALMVGLTRQVLRPLPALDGVGSTGFRSSHRNSEASTPNVRGEGN